MIEVFTKILMQEKILVSPIDETHIPHLVINEKTSCLVTRSSLGKHFPNVLNKLPQKDPISYSNLCPIIGSQQFALTPRERFCHVLLGQVSNSPNPRYRPFSLRDSFDRNPISDFDQAAHDARRMGWLVQAPVTNGKLPLRLPTQWHQEYFTALLRTTPVPEVYYTMAFDDFLEEVIRNMHAKTLIQMFKRENSVPETFYSTQFSSALASLSCETFLISQVPTNNGDGLKEGVVDFACFERDWLVELMRNGSKRADHLHRFTDTAQLPCRSPETRRGMS
ncbi:hypothetical protein BDP27DRAFT_838653 [Rhodocollybia butyracea]|uniref:Uncharacterized protein n=1 Tax=Rhodocollybia butyracea TaxID=206335 RepID=A0A9P5PS02_9AGAR|nr:hypothetical protein BDP27DRAFT_838653 [Rhodocollybia butyracea]